MPDNGGKIGQGGFNPYWAVNGNRFGPGSIGALETEPSWMTFAAAHPLDGSARCVEVDMSGADSRVQILEARDSDTGTKPASAKRWSLCAEFFWQWTGGDVSSDAWIASGAAARSDYPRLIAVPVGAGATCTLDLAIDASNTFSGTMELEQDVWYLLRVYKCENDSVGTALATDQWIVQVGEGTGVSGAWVAGDAPTVTNDIEGSANLSLSTLDLFWKFGDDAGGHGTGVKFRYANIHPGYWTDADDPFGIPRMQMFALTGNGTDTAWTGAYTNIDERPPNDATDLISTLATSAAKESQVLTGIALSAGDVVHSVTVITAARYSIGGKGTQAWWRAYIDDKTLELKGPNYFTTSAGAGDFSCRAWNFPTAPDTTVWAITDVGSGDVLEQGIEGFVAGGGAVELTAMATILSYTAAGEIMPSPPGVPVATAKKYYTGGFAAAKRLTRGMGF